MFSVQPHCPDLAKPFRAGLAAAFWIIVLLRNPSEPELHDMNLMVPSTIESHSRQPGQQPETITLPPPCLIISAVRCKGMQTFQKVLLFSC